MLDVIEFMLDIIELVGYFFTKGFRKKSKSNSVKIWAHRGCSTYYPENTLEAFEAAAKIRGITGIELDIQLTKDNEIVVIHDESVKRTTNGRKNVSEYTLQEIQSLRIAGRNGTDTRVPTLKEVLKLLKSDCIQKKLLINIELKNNKIRYHGMEEKVLALVREFRLENYVIYSSFLPESLKYLKELDPKVKTGALAETIKKCVAISIDVQADALHPKNTGVYGKLPKLMRKYPIRMWNTDEPFYGSNKKSHAYDLSSYAAFGVTDIITNMPEQYL